MDIIGCSDMEELFTDRRDWSPRIDVTETRDAFHIRAELPGVQKDDIQVNCKNAVLTLRGEKHPEIGFGSRHTRHRTECEYGSFLRSFALPDTIDADSIEARYRRGILSIAVPKSEALDGGTKQIEILNGPENPTGSAGE